MSPSCTVTARVPSVIHTHTQAEHIDEVVCLLAALSQHVCHLLYTYTETEHISEVVCLLAAPSQHVGHLLYTHTQRQSTSMRWYVC